MDTAFARRQMVRQQVRTWDVSDPDILNLLGELERDRFVPEDYVHLAYADTEIPLSHGQSMMPPLIEGRLLQSLAIRPGDRVLEIGTGSGYLTACLASLAASVMSVDIFDDLVATARGHLEHTGIDNVDLHVMDAMAELPEGRFDAIAVTGSIAEFDRRFVDALETGGRLFVIVGDAPVMEAQLVVRGAGDDWTAEGLFETCAPPLIHGGRESTFSF